MRALACEDRATTQGATMAGPLGTLGVWGAQGQGPAGSPLGPQPMRAPRGVGPDNMAMQVAHLGLAHEGP